MTERRKILVQEVGPRDGLQNEPQSLPPRVRASLIDELAASGLPRIQIGSFVNPKRVPQMAETDTVWQLLKPRNDLRYSVLVLNERGLDQALTAGFPHVEIYVSASETHSRKNSNAGVAEALKAACRMIERAKNNGMTVTAGVMCALGCFYDGPVPAKKVRELVEAYCALDPDEIGLADTTGMGTPQLVRNLVQALGKTAKPEGIAFHFHDTHGHGLDNLRTALDMGVTRFDSSVGGLGGCPFIPGAKGNISTEQMVQTAEDMGCATGVDLAQVRAVRTRLERLLGRDLQGLGEKD